MATKEQIRADLERQYAAQVAPVAGIPKDNQKQRVDAHLAANAANIDDAIEAIFNNQ